MRLNHDQKIKAVLKGKLRQTRQEVQALQKENKQLRTIVGIARAAGGDGKLPKWYFAICKLIVGLRESDSAIKLEAANALITGYLLALVHSNTITYTECDRLHTVISNATIYTRGLNAQTTKSPLDRGTRSVS